MSKGTVLDIHGNTEIKLPYRRGGVYMQITIKYGKMLGEEMKNALLMHFQ